MSFVALITGASSGIGEATARLLASQPDVQLVLVARRADRLRQLADQIQPDATVIAADLADPATPVRIAAIVDERHGQLNLLVNNAGARWSLPFANGGWDNIEQTMKINFEAPVRLIQALLPVLQRTAAALPGGPATALSGGAGPQAGTADRRALVSIVNVASTAARVSRPSAAAYSASKFALAGWSDGIYHELRPLGIHVGLVNPGFIATEGFPATELRAKRLTRLIVAEPAAAARAIVKAGPGAVPEVYVPGYYWVAAALRILAPGFLRRRIGAGAFTTRTLADTAET